MTDEPKETIDRVKVEEMINDLYGEYVTYGCDAAWWYIRELKKAAKTLGVEIKR